MLSVMEFTTLPPEVTSALIHSGPGAESLIEASGAWQQLGTNLEESADIIPRALSSLTGIWQGPSSAAMIQAVEPYLPGCAPPRSNAQQTAASAQAAAAAFNSVRAAVVPPAQVVANRTRLAQLLATNRFGRNLAGHRRNRSRIPEHVGEQLGGDDSLSGGLGASHHAAPVLLAASTPIRRGRRSSQRGVRRQQFRDVAATAACGRQLAISHAINWPSTPTTAISDWRTPMPTSSSRPDFPINLLSYLAQNQSAQALQGVNGQIGQGVSEGEAALGGLGGAAGPSGGWSALGPGRWAPPDSAKRPRGGDGCWRVDGQADRAARRGGAAARFASAGATRVGGIAAFRG